MADSAVGDGAVVDDSTVPAETAVRDGGRAADDGIDVDPGVIINPCAWVDDAPRCASRNVVVGQVGGCVDLVGADVGAAGGVP